MITVKIQLVTSTVPMSVSAYRAGGRHLKYQK